MCLAVTGCRSAMRPRIFCVSYQVTSLIGQKNHLHLGTILAVNILNDAREGAVIINNHIQFTHKLPVNNRDGLYCLCLFHNLA